MAADNYMAVDTEPVHHIAADCCIAVDCCIAAEYCIEFAVGCSFGRSFGFVDSD